MSREIKAFLTSLDDLKVFVFIALVRLNLDIAFYFTNFFFETTVYFKSIVRTEISIKLFCDLFELDLFNDKDNLNLALLQNIWKWENTSSSSATSQNYIYFGI